MIEANKLVYTASAGVGTMEGNVFVAASDAGDGTITIVLAGSPNPKPAISAVVDVTVTSE